LLALAVAGRVPAPGGVMRPITGGGVAAPGE